MLKLDMIFLKDDDMRRKRRSILGFVVSLARWLDLQVTAEGVETAEQAEKLRSVGCHYAQGYFFSPPLSRENYEKFLQAEQETEAKSLPSPHRDLRERMLEPDAYVDDLTGLLNRRGLNSALARIDYTQANIAVFVFALENRRQWEDDYREKAAQDESCLDCGEGMLHRFGEVLRARTRSGDLLCRIEGDEFVAIMPQMRSPQFAVVKGQEICRAFLSGETGGEKDGKVKCSAGLYFLRSGEAFEDALSRANLALSRAKRAEENVCFL
jgi:diguanylate cyclase (GGDEF)-like protein